MRGGRGRGGRGRGRGTGDKSINMPDLMGQTMTEVGSSSMYQSTTADKPQPLFPPTYIKRFTWEEKDVDQGAELYMMRKMMELESWNAAAPYNLSATPDQPTKAALHADAAAKKLLAYIADIRYTDLYTKELVARSVTGKRKRKAADSASRSKRMAMNIDLLVAQQNDGEGPEDDAEGDAAADATAPPRRPVGEEEDLDDEYLEEADEEDYNDYAELHGDDDDEDDGGRDYDAGGDY